MTTIAYRDGVLASDGRISEGGAILTDRMRKVQRLEDGSLFACAGTAAQCEAYVEWVENGGKRPRAAKDILAVRVYPSGVVELHDKDGVLKMPAGFYAEGSGRAYALGAMAAGASSVEAVKAAMRFDHLSGGRVFALKL